MWLYVLMKRVERLMRYVRAAAVIGVMTSVFLSIGAKKARADFAKTSMGIGRDLMPLADVIGSATKLSLNGQKMLIRYDASAKSVGQVLDAAEDACRLGEVKAPRLNADSIDPTSAAERALRLADLGVIRGGNDEEGAVLCFAKGAETPDGLLAQLEKFSQTNDLGALGKMRYVYAKKEQKGTAVLAAISDDSFRLDALRSTVSEDAPGSDDPILPRPKDSVRLFSGVLEGTPYASRIYRTHADEEDVKRAFVGGMRERGFRSVTVAPTAGRPGATAFVREGVMVIFGTTRDRDGSVLVTLGTIGADPTRAARAWTSSG
jgi:hypothetical protein